MIPLPDLQIYLQPQNRLNDLIVFKIKYHVHKFGNGPTDRLMDSLRRQCLRLPVWPGANTTRGQSNLTKSASRGAIFPG